MLPKPEMKRKMAIVNEDRDNSTLFLFATPEIVEEMKAFGWTNPVGNTRPDYYQFAIDPRYDFDEVVNYLKSYANILQNQEHPLMVAMENKVMELARESAKERKKKKPYRRIMRWSSDVQDWVSMTKGDIIGQVRAGYIIDVEMSDPGWKAHIPLSLETEEMPDQPNFRILKKREEKAE